jgi:hypothetical protein
MPLYEARCTVCKKNHDYYQTVANCQDTPICCGVKTEKVIFNPPMGYVHNIHYTSPIDGRPITTTQARRDDLARNNCRPWEGMEQEKKEAERRAQYEEQKQDAKLEKTINETLAHMPSQKKAVLGLT